MILDTAFLIDLQNGLDDAVEMAAEIEASGAPRRVPHVVLYELYVGIGKGTQTAANRERIDEVVDSLLLEPTTPSVVRRAGEIEGTLQAGGDGVGAVDAIVGATALAYDEPVVTANVDDFDGMEGVTVARY